MAYLLDTNILLRWMRPGDAQHEAARQAIETLTIQGEILYVTTQSILEFWYVATRNPARNGYGLTPEQVEPQVQRIERAFSIVADVPLIYQVWRQLLVAYGVIGIQVFDARLVAVMQTLAIENILTFNGPDFAAYGVNVVAPESVQPQERL